MTQIEEHGTPQGYRRHKRRGEKPCQKCKSAWAKRQAEYRRKNAR